MSAGTKDSGLLSSELLRKLEQLEILVQKRTRSAIKGERSSRARGQSVEFADYRTYSPGDDLRYLDWNLYGRLDKLFIKLYEEERELPVHILLDVSESMNFGQPSKFQFAKKLAAAFGYLTLACFDRLQITVSPIDSISSNQQNIFRSMRGKGMGLKLLSNLQDVTANGAGDLDNSIRRLASQSGAKGVCIIISDFLENPQFLDSLKKLAGAGFQPILLHVLSPQELSPPESGELKLIDSESGSIQEISFGKFRMKSYQKMLTGFCDEIKSTATKTGSKYILCDSGGDMEHILFKTLREKGVLG